MNSTLKKLVPATVRRRILKSVRNVMSKHNKAVSKQIPLYQITAKNIAHTELLVNRADLLARLPKNGVVAELGVDEGVFSELILNTCTPSKLHLIDFWGSERYNQNKRRQVENKFKNQIESGELEINLGLSVDVASRFEDKYFDWIYIDTDHSYQTTLDELEKWCPKIKPGGIMAGHDYIIGNWDGLVRYGVKEAVYEFCSKNDWEIIFLTMEIGEHPSFAIKKIV